MLQTFLTVMLFVMPFLISQKEVSRPGLHMGLWISLFFWGRIYALFSILIFGVSVFFFILQKLDEKHNNQAIETFVDTGFMPDLWIPRSGTRPLIGFLAVLMIFCAFGNVCQDYAATLNLDAAFQKSALLLGFTGSITGPILFGHFSDKTGPFPTFMASLFLGLIGVGFIAFSADFPYLFPFGTFSIQTFIGSVFTLMPLLLLRFYGRPQITFVLPLLLFFLTMLWTAALRFYDGANALPQDYLLSMVFLLIMAAPLATSAWRQRLTVL